MKRVKCDSEGERIAAEQEKCRVAAKEAAHELADTVPAVEAAVAALGALSKEALAELKKLAEPPAIVVSVLSAVLLLLHVEDVSWEAAKKLLADKGWLAQLEQYDAEAMASAAVLHKISKFTANRAGFCAEQVEPVSAAAAALCAWVRAVETHALVLTKSVAPRREKLATTEKHLEERRESLRLASVDLIECKRQIDALQTQYDLAFVDKKKLEEESQLLETKLLRAGQLVEGLSEERSRWELTIKNHETERKSLCAHCVLTAAFLTYFGPFDSEYRATLRSELCRQIEHEFGYTGIATFRFDEFLELELEPTSLPSTDDTGRDNAVLVLQSRAKALHKDRARVPLLVDPQVLANAWLRRLFATSNLQVIRVDTAAADGADAQNAQALGDASRRCLKRLESALQFE